MREPGQIKRSARIGVESPGTLIDSEGFETSVTIVDLSAGGCRIVTDGTPIIGEMVHLRVGRVSDYPAQVRWALGNEAGLAFTGPAEQID